MEHINKPEYLGSMTMYAQNQEKFIDKILSENKELIGNLGLMKSCKDMSMKLNDKLYAENTELIRYSHHIHGCEIISAGFLIARENRKCTCGLDKISKNEK